MSWEASRFLILRANISNWFWTPFMIFHWTEEEYRLRYQRIPEGKEGAEIDEVTQEDTQERTLEKREIRIDRNSKVKIEEDQVNLRIEALVAREETENK